MAQQETIEAQVRTEFGKGASRRDRRDGLIPAVLYGHGSPAQHLNLPYRKVAAILRAHGTNAIINIAFDGKNQLALTKQVTVNPIRSVIEHIDLYTVRTGEKITVEVPIIITGTPAPGSTVNHELTTLEIEADPLNIPEEIEVCVTGIPAGTRILAGAIALPENVVLIEDADALVINITETHDADLGDHEEEASEVSDSE